MRPIARLTVAIIPVSVTDNEVSASVADEQYAKRVSAAKTLRVPLVLLIDQDAAGGLSIRAASDAAVGAGSGIDIAVGLDAIPYGPGVPIAITVEQP